MATTVHKLLRPCSSRSPRGGVLLITGESISEVARELYDPYETGKRLARTALSVEHAGGLANEFGAWASWEGAEVFGGV